MLDYRPFNYLTEHRYRNYCVAENLQGDTLAIILQQHGRAVFSIKASDMNNVAIG